MYLFKIIFITFYFVVKYHHELFELLFFKENSKLCKQEIEQNKDFQNLFVNFFLSKGKSQRWTFHWQWKVFRFNVIIFPSLLKGFGVTFIVLLFPKANSDKEFIWLPLWKRRAREKCLFGVDGQKHYNLSIANKNNHVAVYWLMQ